MKAHLSFGNGTREPIHALAVAMMRVAGGCVCKWATYEKQKQFSQP
jgi:hypothetical protein